MPTGYRAVGPDTSLHQLEEQRKRVIDESKYLGGDMQHTHLVKGLDYVLKQKVGTCVEWILAHLSEN